jgi:hypothetical protein
MDTTMIDNYVPALRFHWLTLLYDPVIALYLLVLDAIKRNSC